jgi:hypothetical protein
MLRYEVELLAQGILDRVERGQPAEDDALVELKRDWPTDLGDAARRVAAHANSARGTEILWLIGVDERARSVVGATGVDPAKWFDQLRSHFESNWAPGVQVVTVPRESVVVVALLFDTSGAPFVVKQGDRLEVPWRGSTQTRSARRAELLQLLVPRTQAPDIHLKRGVLRHRELPDEEFEDLYFELELDVYVTPQNDRSTVLPFYKMKAAIFAKDGTEIFQFRECHADTEIELVRVGDARPRRPPHLEATTGELIVYGPGRAKLFAKGAGQIVDVAKIEKSCEIRYQVRSASGDAPVTLRQHFSRMTREEPEHELVWRATWPASLIPRGSGL